MAESFLDTVRFRTLEGGSRVLVGGASLSGDGIDDHYVYDDDFGNNDCDDNNAHSVDHDEETWLKTLTTCLSVGQRDMGGAKDGRRVRKASDKWTGPFSK